MKTKKIILAVCLGAAILPLTVKAAEYDPDAEVTKISELQWKVCWETYGSINMRQAYVDSENQEYCLYIEDDKDQKTYLYQGEQVIFPAYGNYFTVNLEGMGLADGEYLMTIPEDYVTLVSPGSPGNEEQQLWIIIGDDFNVDHQVSFSELEGNIMDISWSNTTSLEPGNTTGAYMVNTATQEKYDLYYLNGDEYSKANFRIGYNYLRFNVNANYPTLPNGTYKLYLPANYVLFNGGTEGNAAIDGYEFTYSAPWSEGTVDMNGPNADGEITLKWLNASNVEWNENYSIDGFMTLGVVIWDSKDNQIQVSYPQNMEISGNVVTISLDGLNVANGQARLDFAADCMLVTVDGVTNPTKGFIYPFTYNGNSDNPDPEVPEYSLYAEEADWNSAGEGIYEVSWDGTELSLVENPDDEVSVYSEGLGLIVLTYGEEVELSSDNTKLLIDLSGLEEGTYRINVPEAYLYINVDGETYLNMGTSLDNVVIGEEEGDQGGINGIVSENGVYKVYSINGVKVLETKDSTSLQKLPKGVYIINGKKVAK